MCSIKSIYASGRNGAGRPGPKPNRFLVPFALVSGGSSCVGAAFLQAPHRKNGDGFWRTLHYHQPASGDGVDLVVVSTPCIHYESKKLPDPYTYDTNDVVPEPCGDMMRAEMFAWYVSSLRAFERATSPVNEEAHFERSHEPISSPPMPARDEEMHRGASGNVILFANGRNEVGHKLKLRRSLLTDHESHPIWCKIDQLQDY